MRILSWAWRHSGALLTAVWGILVLWHLWTDHLALHQVILDQTILIQKHPELFK